MATEQMYEIVGVNAITVLKVVGEDRDPEGKLRGYDHEAVIRLPGTKLPESDISPIILAKLKDGDPATTAWLKKVGSSSRSSKSEEDGGDGSPDPGSPGGTEPPDRTQVQESAADKEEKPARGRAAKPAADKE